MIEPATQHDPAARGVTRVDPVDDALHALELFALSPLALGGLHLRGWHGPRRQALLGWLRRACASASALREAGWFLLPHHTEPEQLDPGADLAESLRQGRAVIRPGLIDRFAGGVVVLQRAERMSTGLAARLAAALDEQKFALVLLDESLPDEEGPWAGLLDRLALSIDLRDESAWRALDALAALGRSPTPVGGAATRSPGLAGTQTEPRGLTELCRAAQLLGVDSMRRAAQASLLARLSVADSVRGAPRSTAAPADLFARDADLAFAIRQVLLPRATVLPPIPAPDEASADAQEPPDVQPPDTQPPDPPTPEPADTPMEAPEAQAPPDSEPADPSTLPDGASERLIEATLSALPPGLLAALASQFGSRAVASRGTGSGRQTAKGRGRARSVGARRGRPRGSERVHLLATLRAALPWQKLRNGYALQASGDADSRASMAVTAHGAVSSARLIRFHPDDLHVHRERRRRGTTTVFVVDASGSTALQRLSEAKGAVELLLADCYVRRDRVALVSFRGTGAELLLSPTRSLVAARRALTALPGGGGSPVAAGLELAARLAAQLARAGDDVSLVVLTDGRANLSRDGQPGRERAALEARRVARELVPLAVNRVLIDTSVRPEPAAQALAAALAARYLPMPFARARDIRDSIAAATR